MADEIHIRHPQSDMDVRGVPRKFVAAGTANGETITEVKAEIIRLDADGETVGNWIVGRHLFFIEKPGGPKDAIYKYRWMVFFNLRASSQNETYRLHVIGLDDAGNEIQGSDSYISEFNVHPPKYTADIFYPDPDHVISGAEKDYFLAYGSTNRMIVSTQLGEKSADTLYDDLTINFWCAQFTSLIGSPDPQVLRVTDVDSQGDAKWVTISQ